MPFTDTLVLKNNANADVNYLLQGRLAGFSRRIREGDNLSVGRLLELRHTQETNKQKLTLQRSVALYQVPILGTDSVKYTSQIALVYTCPVVSAITSEMQLDTFAGMKSLIGISGFAANMIGGMS